MNHGIIKEGDLCVFFEIDSKLPQCEWSEFMSKKHYKVKSMKLNKFNVISQGLALPLDVFGLDMPQEENVDVTDLLCVTYAVEEDNKRKANVNKYEKMRQRHMKLFKKNKLVKWLYQRKWGDEYFNLIYGIKAIFSYDTALYFLGLCETVPSIYHITVLLKIFC